MISELFAVLLILSSAIAAEPPKGRPIAAIVAEAKDSTGRPRSKALDELAARYPASGEELSAIAEALRSSDRGVQTAGMKALRRVEKTARQLKPQAERMLDDSSERVQLGGIVVAGRIQARELAPKIRAKLAQRPRYKVRKNDFGGVTPQALEYAEEASTALVELDDFKSIDELLSRDEIMAFSSFGGPLVARFGARALPKAVALARQEDTLRSDGGRGVISSMKDPKAIPQLSELARDSDAAIASAATLALSQMPTATEEDKSKIEAVLSEQVKSTDKHVRGAAYDGLLGLAPQKHLSRALDALANDRAVRLSIINAIQKHRIMEAVPALEKFIEEDGARNPNWTPFRLAAAQTIFKLTGRRVLYQGIEKDRRVYSDPYDPSKTH